jgi:hypothetical protein
LIYGLKGEDMKNFLENINFNGLGMLSGVSHRVKNGVCTITFNKKGVVTRDMVKKAFSDKSVKKYNEVDVHIGERVKRIENCAFYFQRQIKRLKIFGATEIGSSAF